MSTTLVPKKPFDLAHIAQQMGVNPLNARLLPVNVLVEPLDPSIAETIWSTAGIQEAAGPITDSGLPRMMKLTAWIAHAGPANSNGDAFLEEDLQEVVAHGLFQPPYLGMVDFNHDFFPYGAWYNARYEYDPIAGQYGIIAEGAMFAWRFNEIADKILAEQSRNGSCAVSMACIAQGIELRHSADGLEETVLRKPVFLTVSVLNVPSADPNARAVGYESEGSSEEDRMVELNKALLRIFAKDKFGQLVEASQTHLQEDTMDFDQVIKQITEAMGDKASEIVAELKEALADAVRVPGLEAKIAELEEKITSLEAEVVDGNKTLAAKDAELEASKTALEAKTTELSEVQEKFTAVQTELDNKVSAEQAAILASIREERLEMLPETFITVLNNRDEESREKVITRLVEMSDEEFEDELQLYSAGSPAKTSYTDRSRTEGGLSSHAGGGSASGLAIDKYLS